MTATKRRRTKIVTGLHPIGRRLADGSRRWYIYAWRGGPQIAVQDAERPSITKDLIRLADEKRAEISGPSRGTVAWLIAHYRASPQFAKLSDMTQRDYKRSLSRIEDEFGGFPIELFEDNRMREAVDDWRNRWSSEPRTADKVLVMLSTLLNWARRERGLLTINVVEGMSLLHEVNKAEDIWEERHWQAVQDVPGHIMRALKLASMTGLRLSDLVALDWSAVQDKAIVVVTQKRKGRAVIPIFPELRAFLDALENRTGAVLLNSRGKQWTASGLESSWQKKQPEGFDRTIHDLRGTYVTWLAVKGFTDEQIVRVVGWRAQKVAEVRARYVDEARVIVSLVDRLSA